MPTFKSANLDIYIYIYTILYYTILVKDFILNGHISNIFVCFVFLHYLCKIIYIFFVHPTPQHSTAQHNTTQHNNNDCTATAQQQHSNTTQQKQNVIEWPAEVGSEPELPDFFHRKPISSNWLLENISLLLGSIQSSANAEASVSNLLSKLVW